SIYTNVKAAQNSILLADPNFNQEKSQGFSLGKIAKENLNNGLKDIRKLRTKPSKTPLQEVQFGPNTASTNDRRSIGG
ncbi:2356_t:CDS:2, partial [Funneliformis geosporum]